MIYYLKLKKYFKQKRMISFVKEGWQVKMLKGKYIIEFSNVEIIEDLVRVVEWSMDFEWSMVKE